MWRCDRKSYTFAVENILHWSSLADTDLVPCQSAYVASAGAALAFSDQISPVVVRHRETESSYA